MLQEFVTTMFLALILSGCADDAKLKTSGGRTPVRTAAEKPHTLGPTATRPAPKESVTPQPQPQPQPQSQSQNGKTAATEDASVDAPRNPQREPQMSPPETPPIQPLPFPELEPFAPFEPFPIPDGVDGPQGVVKQGLPSGWTLSHDGSCVANASINSRSCFGTPITDVDAQCKHDQRLLTCTVDGSTSSVSLN